MRRASLAILLLCAGCPPDLGGFHVVGGDGGGGDDDADGGGGGDDDGGGLAIDGPPGTACPLPHLLVAVEDVSNDDDKGGFVARVPLGGAATTCSALTGQGSMAAQPFAIAWLPPDRVLIASWFEVQALDATTDVFAWQVPFDTQRGVPLDAFAVETGGVLYGGVAWPQAPGGSQIDYVELYTPGGSLFRTWDLDSGGTPLGAGVTGMTRDPLAPGRVLALKNIDYSATEADPFSGARWDPPYVNVHPDLLRRLASLRIGTTNRTVWVGSDGADGTNNGIYYLNDTTGASSGHTVMGPVRCNNRTCDYAHAVPDPLTTHGFYAICATSGSIVRDVVRFASTSTTCETVIAGSSLPPETRIAYLAVAMEQDR